LEIRAGKVKQVVRMVKKLKYFIRVFGKLQQTISLTRTGGGLEITPPGGA